ncbi:2OG-Fe(II) oxygenase family protein [Sphingobium sp.]|uniref:2OG-Fe(II) oxygenase family protein n=1 Tax=Sphingobium sp. TaxID=1912891 RepID=UPI000DB1148E|nr:2OG-Fe(II) oxygenase family protein [Sphingobium sp.]PZU68642.1 MAG: isopenicillin N synthase family oxygenase [Sphingobium sp.]
MTNPVQAASWKLDPGAIYSDVYQKRIDDRPVVEIADLERARVSGGKLDFDSSEQAAKSLRDGVFLLEIPSDIDIAACDLFARQFFRGPNVEPYGQFREFTPDSFEDPLLGFHERINQIEQFLLERRFWHGIYPPEISRCAENLTSTARLVLRGILQMAGIPQALWPIATGGCSDGNGSYHLTFNHYRPSVAGIGLSSHKDDGFMTILRTTEPGLEVNRNDRWEGVSVDPGFFVVNFGLSMEVLTRNCKQPVAAIMHRVRHQETDRFSFGHFSSSYCEPGAAAGIFSYELEGNLRHICSSRELIDANDAEIYFGTRRPEGQ